MVNVETDETNEGEENLSDNEVLGILEGSSLAEIRARFNEVTSAYANNPDARNPENQKQFLKIEESYKRLRDVAKAKEGKK